MSTQKNNTDDIHGLASDMGRLCMNELYSDVVFLVEDQRLSAHRLVLAARSEYFRAMLYGDLAESKEREIRLEVPLEAFKIILEYLYSGKLPLSILDVDEIIDVLNLAHFYGLEYVERAITNHLQKSTAVSNVCVILNAARRYDLDQLTKECLKFMDNNAVNLLKHDSIKMLSKESFEEVLRRDNFCVPEVEIFRSVCKWRDNNPSEDIQTLLSLVRLPLMSKHELRHVVHPSGIFTPDQLLDAIDQINTGINLPHRAVMLPGEDVASEKFHARRITDNVMQRVIQLGQVYKINYIKIVIRSYDVDIPCFTVDVSCDQIRWDSVGTYNCYEDTPDEIRFTARTVHYIRIQYISRGGRNTNWALQAKYLA
ncbi:BTB/POZ domain-containing protein 9-like [Drosophila obscura]|uniref:BTB/POZ domain-containing protein 9-like n=1 Tax=Drosophila obscura TaxID=7282 RepID=UPI001BB12469|nr:BTB/POZ domain-containing protein 9-like [Drosophila obscura]